jgi:SpoVK/Ycf46/Vps4 family AAA+-type ATPase
MDNQDFTSNWESARSDTPCIVAFEDADRLFDENERFHKEIRLTLDCVLNAVQGIQPSDGIILFATANDVNRLPEALGKPDKNDPTKSTRAGRLDFMLEFKELEIGAREKVASVILKGYPELIRQTVAAGAGETGAQFTKRCTDAMSEILKNGIIEPTTEIL